jgi:hypothetical protein
MNDIILDGFSNWAGTCLSYVGPGSGITMLWALLAVLGGVLFMVFGLLFWPLRVLLRAIKKKKANGASENSPNAESQASEVTSDVEQTVPSSKHS